MQEKTTSEVKILLIDNYDSFVYNIVGLLQKCRQGCKGLEWDVVRNDCVPLDRLSLYDAIILSPGPGVPSEAGQMMALLRRCVATHPVLGICLGCQAIAETFGAALRCLPLPRHGHCTELREVDKDDEMVGFYHHGSGSVARYHSWVIDEASLPEDSPLIVSSRDEEGHIMSFRHRELPLFGVQFHPESAISVGGEQLLRNFITLTRRSEERRVRKTGT